MLFTFGHPTALSFVQNLSDGLREETGKGLSRIQFAWLAFCLTAMICCHELNWDEFERASMGTWKAKALGAMLRHSKIPWDQILFLGATIIIRLHGIKEGILVGDDSDRERSREVEKIFGAHKTKDKKRGGYVVAQNIVLLLLVTKKITIPVGFMFYRPDPGLQAWAFHDAILRAQGLPKSQRPPKPAKNPAFPSRTEILETLIRRFRERFQSMSIAAILFDAAYLTPTLRRNLSPIYPEAQIISQLKCNQLVQEGGKKFRPLEEYFRNRCPQSKVINLRGGMRTKDIEFLSARVFVKSHGHVLHVVAMRYKGEQDYRYITATDLTWRAEDIIRCYTLRWLVEVEFEDWKLYEGYGRRAMQQGEEGACRGVILSLVVDHLLLSHPLQIRRSRAGQPLFTVGTLSSIIQLESLLDSLVRCLNSSEMSLETREKLRARIHHAARSLRESGKHLSGREGVLDYMPSPSLSMRFRHSA